MIGRANQETLTTPAAMLASERGRRACIVSNLLTKRRHLVRRGRLPLGVPRERLGSKRLPETNPPTPAS